MIEKAILEYLSKEWEESADSTLGEMEALVESWKPEAWDIFTKNTEVQLLQINGY